MPGRINTLFYQLYQFYYVHMYTSLFTWQIKIPCQMLGSIYKLCTGPQRGSAVLLILSASAALSKKVHNSGLTPSIAEE